MDLRDRRIRLCTWEKEGQYHELGKGLFTDDIERVNIMDLKETRIALLTWKKKGWDCGLERQTDQIQEFGRGYM